MRAWQVALTSSRYRRSYDINKVIDAIKERHDRGSRFTILAVAEGAISKEDAKLSKKEYKKNWRITPILPVSYADCGPDCQEERNGGPCHCTRTYPERRHPLPVYMTEFCQQARFRGGQTDSERRIRLHGWL